MRVRCCCEMFCSVYNSLYVVQVMRTKQFSSIVARTSYTCATNANLPPSQFTEPNRSQSARYTHPLKYGTADSNNGAPTHPRISANSSSYTLAPREESRWAAQNGGTGSRLELSGTSDVATGAHASASTTTPLKSYSSPVCCFALGRRRVKCVRTYMD